MECGKSPHDINTGYISVRCELPKYKIEISTRLPWGSLRYLTEFAEFVVINNIKSLIILIVQLFSKNNMNNIFDNLM